MPEADEARRREDSLRELVEMRVLDERDLQAELTRQDPEQETHLRASSRVPAVSTVVRRAFALIVR